jgi:hypothetical protein
VCNSASLHLKWIQASSKHPSPLLSLSFLLMRVASQKGQKTTTEDGCTHASSCMGVGAKKEGEKRVNIPVNKQKVQKFAAEGVVFTSFCHQWDSNPRTGFIRQPASDCNCYPLVMKRSIVALRGVRTQHLLLQTHGRVTTELTGVTSRAESRAGLSLYCKR